MTKHEGCVACGSHDLYPNCMRLAICENHYFEWMLGNPHKTLKGMKKMWEKQKEKAKEAANGS